MRPAGFDHKGAGGQTPSNEGDSPWQGVYGANNTEWITDAFTYARKYAPSHTKLFYNDFNEWQTSKRNGITSKVLKSLFEANPRLLVGMGMQSHVSANPNDSWSGENNHLPTMEHYAGIGPGFEVHLTELDPSTNNGTYTSQQPGRYSAIFQKALDINTGKVSSLVGKGKVTAICIWTPNDANTWLDKEDKKNTPALHDANNNRKPAYNAVAALVPEADWGDGNNPTFGGEGTINPEITVTCNLNNLASSYNAGSSVPRPNVVCSEGTPGAASFSSNGNEVSGWANPSGTHPFYNPGTRTATLSRVTCGSTTVTTNLTCSGSFEIVPATTPEPTPEVTCNVNNLESSYVAGSSVPRPNVSCGEGISVGTASFTANGSDIAGWESPDGTHQLYVTGERTVTLNSIGCGSSYITLDPAITCGSFEIVEETTPIAGVQSLTNSPAPVEIYNLKGHKVDMKSPLPSGIYIAKARGMRGKIFVVK
jgi:hypothetical protein